jgi:DNA helicase HerA-like ATPase
MKIGSVFDQSSTTEFIVMLDPQYDKERLLFSYVEVSPDAGSPSGDGERIIARITSLHKENPLLSRDQAGVSAAVNLGDLGFEFSRRFTYGWAKCTVIGTLLARRLDMNRRVIAPNSAVHTPSRNTLRQLFFDPSPAYVPLGAIETFGDEDVAEVPVTLNADPMVTKHFCVFGMTGSGKTNTAAKLIEELMARRHRMVIFDSHNDYCNLENFTNLFSDISVDGQRTTLASPPDHDALVQQAIARLKPPAVPSQHDGKDRDLALCVRERLLRAASVVVNNTPARHFLIAEGRTEAKEHIPSGLVEALCDRSPWDDLLRTPRVRSLRCFPELKFYGNGFSDFTIRLLQAFQGEAFSPAQWRALFRHVGQNGTGMDYLANVRDAVENDAQVHGDTKPVIRAMMGRLRGIYTDALTSGSQSLDLDEFFRMVAVRTDALPQTVYRLSLSDLSGNLRKAMVYGVVTYFFRQFKFRGFRARQQGKTAPNAYPALFVLEEARSLIPRTSGTDDTDVAGKQARDAMRELAYEGRKFSLGFGLISQKPSTIDPEVVSQSNTFILHQLKSPDDQEYVRAVTESMSRDELDMVKSLGTGRAIVAGVGVKSPVLMRVYFRYSEEGIEEPTPIQDELGSVTDIRNRLGIQ